MGKEKNKKDKIVTTRVTEDCYKEIVKKCKELDISQGLFVRFAIEKFLKKKIDNIIT